MRTEGEVGDDVDSTFEIEHHSARQGGITEDQVQKR